MRDIKFKVWYKDLKVMEPVAGWALVSQSGQLYTSGPLQAPKLVRDEDSYELLRFTGLTDKDGTEIYEGDIIQFEGEKEYGVVKWMDGCWGYGLYWPATLLKDEDIPLSSWIENKSIPFSVVGDIYQNPELIKNDNS